MEKHEETMRHLQPLLSASATCYCFPYHLFRPQPHFQVPLHMLPFFASICLKHVKKIKIHFFLPDSANSSPCKIYVLFSLVHRSAFWHYQQSHQWVLPPFRFRVTAHPPFLKTTCSPAFRNTSCFLFSSIPMPWHTSTSSTTSFKLSNLTSSFPLCFANCLLYLVSWMSWTFAKRKPKLNLKHFH